MARGSRRLFGATGVILLLSAGCGGAARRGGSTATEPGSVPAERADAALLECGRLESMDTLEQGHLDLSDEATEGGYAQVGRQGDTVVRIVGGLLGESVRFLFDYRYRDGSVVCASESVTSMQTIMAAEPAGPAPYWRFDFLFFDGPDLVSQITARAPADAEPFHGPEELRLFAARLHELATTSVGEAAPEAPEGDGAPEPAPASP